MLKKFIRMSLLLFCIAFLPFFNSFATQIYIQGHYTYVPTFLDTADYFSLDKQTNMYLNLQSIGIGEKNPPHYQLTGEILQYIPDEQIVAGTTFCFIYNSKEKTIYYYPVITHLYDNEHNLLKTLPCNPSYMIKATKYNGFYAIGNILFDRIYGIYFSKLKYKA